MPNINSIPENLKRKIKQLIISIFFPETMSDTKSFKTVLLLRSGSGKDEDNYSQLSNCHNINLINLPVLTFNFTNSDDLIREVNDNHQSYEAIVFTSQRAVESVEFILPQIDNFSEKWTQSKLCYVVGEETVSKGQIISECLFDVFRLSKKTVKNLTNFFPRN